MIINKVEVGNIDIFDLEESERFEKAVSKVTNCFSNLDKNATRSEIIKAQCTSVFECLDELFGEDTHKNVFGGKVNLLTCLKAFEELINQVKEQEKEIENITSKYSPNRAQRRKEKK